MSNGRVNMNEPLLRSPTTRTPPRQAFQIRDRNETEEGPHLLAEAEHANAPDDTAARDATAASIRRERALELQTLKVLGRPFAADISFWYESLPVAVVLGVIVGLSCLFFLWITNAGFYLWFQFPANFSEPTTKTNWKWHLLVTTTGGALAGLLYMIPKAPGLGAVRSFVHNMADLHGNPQETITVVLSGGIALMTGAPLGPEQVLGAIGSGIAAVLARWLRVPRRTEALWIQTALSASLGGFFPCLLVGPVVIHEMSVTSRPSKITVDAVVAHEVLPTDTDPTNGDVSTAASSSVHPEDHDYIEVFILNLVSATLASLVIRWIHLAAVHSMDLTPVPNDFEVWHLAAALPLGVLCAVVGSSVLVLNLVIRGIRQRLSRGMVRLGAPVWLISILFPTIAGLVHGLLGLYFPYATGTGLSFLRDAWNAAIQKETLLSVSQLSWTAVVRVVGLSVSLGFGLIGGTVIPTLVVGFCMGLALSLSISSLPLSLVVPCCMAACPVSIFPAPVTAVIAISLLTGCSAEQTGPILIASVVAFTITGGTGVLRRLGNWQLVSNDNDVEDETSGPRLPRGPLSDDEILQGVRSAIFGSV
jgi:H+/Cl- antiporter ClcA